MKVVVVINVVSADGLGGFLVREPFVSSLQIGHEVKIGDANVFEIERIRTLLLEDTIEINSKDVNFSEATMVMDSGSTWKMCGEWDKEESEEFKRYSKARDIKIIDHAIKE